MTQASEEIRMVQYLRRRLLPLAAGIGLLLTLLGPLTYWIIEHRNLHRVAHLYAEDLAEKFQRLALESPGLWKYQAYKFIGITQGFHPTVDVLGFSVLDERGEPITGYDYNGGAGERRRELTFTEDLSVSLGAAPILFNNRQLGSVVVLVSDARLRQATALHLGLSALIGAGLALLVYRFPVRVVCRMEEEILQLVEAVERSGEKYRSLVTNIPDIAWTADSCGDVVFISPNVERVLGYSPAEVYRTGASPWLDRIHPDDGERVKGAYEALFTGGTSFDMEYRIERTDGEWLWVHNRATATYLLEGRAFADGLLTDISARKRTAAEVYRLNEELQTLYRISLATSRTIEMDQLLADLLHTLAETKTLPFEINGSIFLREGELLRLASTLCPSERAVDPCREIRPGECLCGRAAATGEVVISSDFLADERDTNCTPEGDPHGHLIIPLKAASTVVGVLHLFTTPGTELNEHQLNLFSAIGSQVGIAINNARLYEETRSISLHDPLTGLANRRFLEIQLGKCFDAARRYGEMIAVIMADIDHFKAYNDSRGHPEGDRLLMQVAAILSRGTRDADYVFRYGGEEFLLLLPWTDTAAACATAERLRKTVEEEMGITISLGVVACQQGMMDKESLIQMADEALYRAKQNGRNRVETGGSG